MAIEIELIHGRTGYRIRSADRVDHQAGAWVDVLRVA